MTRRSDEENSKWENLQKNLDVMFHQITEMHSVQKQMKAQLDLTAAAMDEYTQEQHLISQQVQANGEAIARVTLRQMEEESKKPDQPQYGQHHHSDTEDVDSLILDDNASFHNVFAKDTMQGKAQPSRQHKTNPKQYQQNEKRQDNKGQEHKSYTLPKPAMPKMDFPDFEGSDPKVWLDNCRDYFELYQIPEGMWVTAARMHLKGKAGKWYQAFKQKNTFRSWTHFCGVIEQEFGSDDFRSSMHDLLALKQTGSIDEYTEQFQALQYSVTMHNAGYDGMFFSQQYVLGLKEDIRGMVEAHRPPDVLQASILAKIQQRTVDRGKSRYPRQPYPPRPYQNKTDPKSAPTSSNLWQDRQLRDYRKANNLCYNCGEKFVPGHLEVCKVRNKPKVNALAFNDLDRELSDEVLSELTMEDALHEEFCQLSLNALSSQDKPDCIKLKTRVKNKVMLILVDSGSTHSFINSQFVTLANIPTIPISPRKVKLANGEWITTNSMVSQLQCYC